MSRGNINNELTEIQQLKEELSKLKETNGSLNKEINKKRKTYIERKYYESNKSLDTHITDENIKNICQILGFAIEYLTEDGSVSAVFHHWIKGIYITNSSISISATENNSGEIVRHRLLRNSVPWITLGIPDNLNIRSCLKDIYVNSFYYVHREKQINDFKAKFPLIDIQYSSDLINLELTFKVIMISGGNYPFVFHVAFLYDFKTPYPVDYTVRLIGHEAELDDNEKEEQTVLMIQQLDPFRYTNLTEAYTRSFGPDTINSTFQRTYRSGG